MLDLVVLVADKNMKFAFEGLLLNRRLTIRALDAAVFPHPKRDPGVLRQCHDFLRSQQRLAAYAVVMFDRAGCGSEESRVVLESEVEARMAANGWVGRSAGSVNLIWSLLITSFGPTHELMVLPCRMALAEAEPCEARRAERLGRSEGQRHPARAAPAAPVAIPVSSCGPPVCAGTGRTRFRSR